jgi:dipeptidase E
VNGQIVAMGGATSPAEDHDPRIDALILSLTGRPRPRVCYLGTAGGDHEHGTYAFYRAMSRHDCRPTELTFFERVVENLEAFVNDQDVFWVAGGSTANLLAIWRLHGLDSLLQTADERGAVLGDVSAGMNYWFEGTTTDSFGPALRALPDGLGFLSSSACPHYDTHPSAGRSSPACGLASAACRTAADDFAALHFGTASSSSPSTGATRLGVTASSPVLRSHCQLGSSDDTTASRRASSAPETCRKRTPGFSQ